MQLTLDLPDELSAALAASGPDLPRAAMEDIALEAYRERKLTTAPLRCLLGFESRYELDGFLKRHEVWLDYSWQTSNTTGRPIGASASKPGRGRDTSASMARYSWSTFRR